MEAARHSLMDNRVQVYQRPNSPHWQCSCSIAGKQRRTTTKEESLARAKDVARDWYLTLMGKYQKGELKEGKSFREAAERFVDEFATITEGERSPVYIAGHRFRIDNHLIPFFGDLVLPEITDGKIQEYRIHRMKTGMSRIDQFRQAKAKRKGEAFAVEDRFKPPSRSTLHQEIVCLRQILKTAKRHGWIAQLPDLSAPYQASKKIEHRAWFSLEEYQRLYRATKKRARKPLNPKWKWECQQLHDFVLFMANTGLRPDEAYRLEFRDVEVIEDEATKETILLIAVRGKRGVGYCKSMPNAVRPFERLRDRKRASRTAEGKKQEMLPSKTDRLFPKNHHELFNAILRDKDLNLKVDREGQRRTAYSLRHTYICFRLMEGADIYQIAKNCRTSVEMIEKYYASHIQNSLDASAINVLKSRKFLADEDEEIENHEAKAKPKQKVEARTSAPKRYIRKREE